MASTHHWALCMSLKVSNIVSQILGKDYDKNKYYFSTKGAQSLFFQTLDTPTEGSSDNES